MKKVTLLCLVLIFIFSNVVSAKGYDSNLNSKKYNTDKLKQYAINIFNNLDLNGYARIDFFYDEEKEEIYVNEVNTIPGFTSISMYPKLMKHEGIDYTNLITILINNA